MSGISSEKDSLFSVFGIRQFVFIYLAFVFALMGLALVEIAAAWTIAEAGGSPGLVSLVATSSTLPIVLFIVPFGAWADMGDRRRQVAVSCIIGATACTLMATGTWLGGLPHWVLLSLVGVCGMTTAMRLPALNASVPGAVSARQMPTAMMMVSISTSISRSLAALAALAAFSLSGAGLAFAIAGATLTVALVSILGAPSSSGRWPTLPALYRSMLEIFSFTSNTPEYGSILGRGFLFFMLGASGLSLLPILVVENLNAGANTFMSLMGAISLGALVSGLLASPLRKRIGHEAMLRLSCLCLSAGGVVLALSTNVWLSAAAAFIHGAGWVNGLAGFTIMAQLILPDWIRARGMAAAQMALIGGVAFGSAFWGQVANHAGTSQTVMASASLLAVLTVWPGAMTLRLPEPSQLALKRYWPDLTFAGTELNGPAAIIIEHQVQPEHFAMFMNVMQGRRRSRLREGAHSWSLLRDAEYPYRVIEVVSYRTIEDRIAQTGRTTLADYRDRESLFATLEAGSSPIVRNFFKIA